MRKSIDGITPRRRIRTDHTPPVKPAARQVSSPIAPVVHELLKPGHGTRPPRAVRSIDGMVVRPPRRIQVPASVEVAWQARPRVGFDTPEFIDDPIVKGKVHTKASRFRKLLALLQYPLVALVAVVAVYSASIGQWLVLAYALYALVRRVDSRATFVAALILLVAIPVFQILKQPGVAENIAVYAYELLVVGTLQAVVELIATSKRKQRVV